MTNSLKSLLGEKTKSNSLALALTLRHETDLLGLAFSNSLTIITTLSNSVVGIDKTSSLVLT